MKFLHLSDLHLGIRLKEFSLLEDQRYILEQILRIEETEQPDAVLIAGDVYDKSTPSAEAVQLFDEFLTRLSEKRKPVFVISGNHDSPERIAFASRLIRPSGVYLAPVFSGAIEPVILHDEWGETAVYSLPFVRPATVRHFAPEETIESYNDAMRVAIAHMNVNPARRNLLIAHQFVTGAQRCDSEDISVGGVDNVEASLFSAFDYVALGHIHNPQYITRESIRYCGTPLKYSLSEANSEKSAVIVVLQEKGDVSVRTIPLLPLRDLRRIRGSFDELMRKKNYEGTNTQDYTAVTLTDESDVPDAIARLRSVYKNIVSLEYDNARTHSRTTVRADVDPDKKTPLELLECFYEMQNNRAMTEEQTQIASAMLTSVWEENTCDR